MNLTDAQKAQIKTIMQAQRATIRPLIQQLEENRQAELNATAGGAFDQAKVQALATQRSQIMAQLMVQKAQVRSQIYNTDSDRRPEGQGRPDAAEEARSHQRAAAEAVGACAPERSKRYEFEGFLIGSEALVEKRSAATDRFCFGSRFSLFALRARRLSSTNQRIVIPQRSEAWRGHLRLRARKQPQFVSLSESE